MSRLRKAPIAADKSNGKAGKVVKKRLKKKACGEDTVMERVTRRGLIKALGSAAASLGLAGKGVAEPTRPAVPETAAFRYTCSCGTEVVAQVPREVDDKFTVHCYGCKAITELKWKGDHFAMKAVSHGLTQTMEEGAERRVSTEFLQRMSGKPFDPRDEIFGNDEDEG